MFLPTHVASYKTMQVPDSKRSYNERWRKFQKKTGIASHLESIADWTVVAEQLASDTNDRISIGQDDTANLLTLGQTRRQYERSREVFSRKRDDHDHLYRNLDWVDATMTSKVRTMGKGIE